MAEPAERSTSLAGRRAFVTGATQGIGLAIAQSLAGAGARLCINGPADDDELEQARREVGDDALALAADLSRPDEVEHLLARIDVALGGIDILVLNAALQEREPWQGIGRPALDRQVEVNLAANLRLIQALTPGMMKRGWGRLIAIGSIQQVREHPEMLIYAASKAALESMVRNLARQLGPRGVTCNVLAPGVIETARNRDALADAAYRDTVTKAIPLRSFGTPQDCAAAALFLASDGARYITGTTLFVDGGMHL